MPSHLNAKFSVSSRHATRLLDAQTFSFVEHNGRDVTVVSSLDSEFAAHKAKMASEKRARDDQTFAGWAGTAYWLTDVSSGSALRGSSPISGR